MSDRDSVLVMPRCNVKLLFQFAEAVAAAHGVGVLHKDLKPSNILIALVQRLRSRDARRTVAESSRIAYERTMEIERGCSNREPVVHGLLPPWSRFCGFPSDKNLRFDLMDHGFSPASADSVVSVFRRSIEFAGFDREVSASSVAALPESVLEPLPYPSAESNSSRPKIESQSSPKSQNDGDDKIPIRLTGGRKAWLIVPTPFYEADKSRLKAQIDVLLTEDADDPLR